MMIVIERVINNPVNSNCFIIYSSGVDSSCVIIDPGSRDNSDLFRLLEERAIYPGYIILTHEHFDHCWGVNALRERYPDIHLICSLESNKAIASSKGNCSVFYDNLNAFEIQPADVIIEKDDTLLSLGNIDLRIVRTPGHTRGSISVIMNKSIFTGDALIPGYKTVTKLPGASVEDQKKTELFFKTLGGYMIYPGHEGPVEYDATLFKWYL